MIRRAANYFSTIPPVFLDGLIYVLLSVVAAWMGILSSDSARAFIGPVWMFWVGAILSTLNAGLLALKMFRSTSYADHQKDKARALLSSSQVAADIKQTPKEKNDLTTF